MRHAYLLHTNPGAEGTCRGGVGAADPDGNDYSIEIGHGLRGDPRMMAFCAHMDEIEEILLHNTTSKLTAIVMQSWWDEEKRLKKEFEDSKNYPAIEPEVEKAIRLSNPEELKKEHNETKKENSKT